MHEPGFGTAVKIFHISFDVYGVASADLELVTHAEPLCNIGIVVKSLYRYAVAERKVRLHAGNVKSDILPLAVSARLIVRYPEQLLAERMEIIRRPLYKRQLQLVAVSDILLEPIQGAAGKILVITRFKPRQGLVNTPFDCFLSALEALHILVDSVAVQISEFIRMISVTDLGMEHREAHVNLVIGERKRRADCRRGAVERVDIAVGNKQIVDIIVPTLGALVIFRICKN